MRTEDQQVINRLRQAKNILIAFKKNYTGDALASALALYLFLNKVGKKARVYSAHFTDARTFSFLPSVRDIRPELTDEKKFVISLATGARRVKEITYRRQDDRLEFFITPEPGHEFGHEHISSRATGHRYDAIITVGTPDLESLSDIYHRNTDLFFTVPTINIDHRPENEAYGQINVINITALATAEIVFDMLKCYAGEHITAEVATCLLTGIMAESKSFKIGSLTPRSLVAASELMELGADRELIVRHLYQNRSLTTLKLWGRVLAKLNSGSNGKLVWSSLNHADLQTTDNATAALHDVVEELIGNIPEAQLIVVFSETAGATQAILYAAKNINAAAIAKELGATGDKQRAVLESTRPLDELENAVISHLKQKLEKLPV